MRTLLIAALAVAGLFVACSPPCDPITVVAQSVCLKADAGTPAAGAPFTVFAAHNYSSSASCTVGIDGGEIVLTVTPTAGALCTVGAPNGARAPLPPAQPEPCRVPALDAGSYVINTSPTPTTLTLPYDGGLAACP